jgi:hypothetical protein
MVDLLKALEDRTLRDTGAPWEAPMPMNRFVHEQNLRHLRAMLARANDEVECRRIVALIEEEEEKWAAEIRYRNSHD